MLVILTKIILIAILLYSLKVIVNILRERSVSGYTFLIPVFILFYVIPIYTDDLTGMTIGTNYPALYESNIDYDVSVFYNIYCAFVLLLFVWHAKRLKNVSTNRLKFNVKSLNSSLLNIYKKWSIGLWLIAIFPIFYIVFLKGFEEPYHIYLERSSVYNLPDYHNFVAKCVLISMIITAFITTAILLKYKNVQGKPKIALVIILMLLITLFWIHGKRSIVANYIFVQLVFLIITKSFSFKQIFRIASVLGIVFFSFILFYGKNISTDTEKTYSNLRVDFSRDYGVKFALYNEVKMERAIIPSKFSTFMFSLLFFVPRSYWPSKPQPYAVYFTNSAFGNFGGDILYGWGFTTSLFTESISNLGLIGLIFTPLLLMYIFRKEAYSRNPFFKLISITVGVLLCIVQPVSFMVIILIYIFLLIKENRKKVF